MGPQSIATPRHPGTTPVLEGAAVTAGCNLATTTLLSYDREAMCKNVQTVA